MGRKVNELIERWGLRLVTTASGGKFIEGDRKPTIQARYEIAYLKNEIMEELKRREPKPEWVCVGRIPEELDNAIWNANAKRALMKGRGEPTEEIEAEIARLRKEVANLVGIDPNEQFKINPWGVYVRNKEEEQK